jgi:outer membrane protein TolC
VLAGVSFACSPAAYRQSADIDVNRLLKDRQQSTLDYTPREPAVSQEPAPINKKSAYARIPLSSLPPATQPALDRPHIEVPYGPIGPVMTMPSGVAAPEPEATIDPLEASQDRQSRRLMLGPPSPFERLHRMDLFGSLSYAVVHSRTYQTQSEQMYISALDVTLQRHLLSPRPFARTSVQFTGGQADVEYAHALTATGSVGVRQKLPYGGEIVASTLVNFVNALNGPVADGESAQLALSGSVPLLRGAGLVNLEGLINSERQLVYQVRAFEDFRRQFAVDIASAYFRLLTLQQSVSNRRLNLASLRLLTERTNALYAAGKQTFLEVQRSLQSQLTAENQLLNAQDAYDTALDEFKVRIGLPVESRLEIVPVTIELRLPDIDSQDVFTKALHYRLDLQTARDQVEDARRGVAIAQNGLAPDLNLTGSGSVGNRPNTPARQVDGRNTEYAAGVTLDLPIDRVSERNAYRRSLIDLDRAARSVEDLSQRILADVRDSIRSIRTAEQTLDIQRNSIQLAERRMEFANELLRESRPGITARDVVEAQNALLSAQDAYDQAQASLQIQVLQFLRDTGTLRVDKSAGSIGHALDRIEAMGEQSKPKLVQ